MLQGLPCKLASLVKLAGQRRLVFGGFLPKARHLELGFDASDEFARSKDGASPVAGRLNRDAQNESKRELLEAGSAPWTEGQSRRTLSARKRARNSRQRRNVRIDDAMSLYVRGRRARFLMNWVPVVFGVLLVVFLAWWVWRGLNNLGS